MAKNWWKYLVAMTISGGAGYLAGWFVTRKIVRKKCDEEVQSVIEEFKGKYGPSVRSKKIPFTPTEAIDETKDALLINGENREIFRAPKPEEMAAYHKVVRDYKKPDEKEEEDTIHKIISDDEIETINHDVYYYWPNGTVMDQYNSIISEQELMDYVGNTYVKYFKEHPDADSVCIRNTQTNDEFEIIRQSNMDYYPLDDGR